MSKYVPSEIQEEILKRLPVKPLIKFRSVSKPWKSLIDSPDFIAAYGVRQTHPDRLILRYTNKNDNEDRYSMFVDNDDDHTFTRQDFAPKVPDPIIKCKGDSYIVGSSNGLLCYGYYYHYGTDRVVLWNLSISKFICIEFPYMHDLEDEDVVCIGVDCFIGFGVCPVTLDPTIVKIEYICDDGFPWKVGVFTLSTRTWSFLSTDLPRESISLGGSNVVIRSFIYWVGFDTLAAQDGQSQSRYLIMSFDLTAKEFKEINLTNSLTNHLGSILIISKLRESLVLFAYHTVYEEVLSGCSLWKMMERGVSRWFTKLYNINVPHATINRLLGFRKTGELILKPQQEFKPNSEVQIYDPDSEAISNLGIGAESSYFFMWSYVETLLLHDQLDGFIYSSVTDHE